MHTTHRVPVSNSSSYSIHTLVIVLTMHRPCIDHGHGHAYFNFCAAHGIASPFPPTPSSLIGWAVYDFKIRQLAASSDKQYVTSTKSVCRILDIESSAFSSFQLHYVPRGMAKICPRRFITSPRLPITIWLLAAMFEKMATPLTRLMRTIKAALSSGVYGMLRSAEFLAKGINPCPLARADLKWCSQVVEVRLRFTKGDIYHTGVVVKLFKNGSATCPYTLLKEAWDTAPFKSSSSPVFQNDDGSALSYKTVQEVLSLLAVALGLDPDTFKLHGLRIGGATTLLLFLGCHLTSSRPLADGNQFATRSTLALRSSNSSPFLKLWDGQAAKNQKTTGLAVYLALAAALRAVGLLTICRPSLRPRVSLVGSCPG